MIKKRAIKETMKEIDEKTLKLNQLNQAQIKLMLKFNGRQLLAKPNHEVIFMPQDLMTKTRAKKTSKKAYIQAKMCTHSKELHFIQV